MRGLDTAFPEPQESLPVGVFRDRLEELAAKTPMIPPNGLETLDWVMEVAKRPVRLRAYLPEGAGPDAMLYMHGGGWMLGSIEGHDQVCADLAAETGLRVVSIDYALSPEHRYPVALEECLAALAALRGGRTPLGPVRDIWAGGDSAGGNLALATALRARDDRLAPVAGLFLVYPCTDPDCSFPSYTDHADAPFLSAALMRRFWAEYLGDQAPDAYAAPARANLNGLPPALILTAALDPLVDEGEALANALNAAGRDVWHHRAEGLIHGLLRFRAKAPIAQRAFAHATDALKSRLRQ